MFEDILGRSEIRTSIGSIRKQFAGKVVLVTGAAGSIGSELCRQLAQLGVMELILFDNAETPLHDLRLSLSDRYPTLKYFPIIGDVRFPDRLDYVFKKFRPQIVFHAAAYKHVPLMEENPCEGLLVNLCGTRHVAEKCLKYDVDTMVMISTDKAVNPTSIMGCTKRLAEMYVQGLGHEVEIGHTEHKTRFVTTRFGNVLGSNGSVVPLFNEQIRKGGPVTVTHPEITRYFMTIPEACLLVMEAAMITQGNEIVIFDMGNPIKILDLAKSMIRLAGKEPDVDIKIQFTGLRPGEKLYEEVLASEENTLPTNHERIRIARVRETDYEEMKEATEQMFQLASQVKITELVKLMKKIVPEYKSNNSIFEQLD